MRQIVIMGCLAVIVMAASVLPIEARTERRVVTLPQERSLLENASLNPEQLLPLKEPTTTQPKEVQPNESKRKLVKRDEVSDYEGWENKRRKK